MLLDTPQRPQAGTTTGSPQAAGATTSDLPSSGTKRAAAIAAPSIFHWLQSIDDDEGRGRHNIYVIQYSSKLHNNGIYDLTDMGDITVDEFIQMTEAPLGVAKRLIKYAEEDIAKLTASTKRARLEQY